MKKVSLFLASMLFAFSMKAQLINLRGSETMFPAFVELVNEYNKTANKKAKINYDGSGSTLGLMSLFEGQTDIAITTREATKSEQAEAQDKGIDLKGDNICKDALVIVTSMKNPIYKLSKKEVGLIFSGRLINWSEVGGEDQNIRTFIRANSSGSYKGFQEMFLTPNGLEYSDDCHQMRSNAENVRAVEKYPNGVTYMSYAYYKKAKSDGKQIKLLRICTDDEKKSCEEVTEDNVTSGKYPIMRNCYIYYNNKKADQLKEFIAFMQSEKAKAILNKNEFIVK